MSDWTTHVLMGWVIFELISARWNNLEKHRSLFLLGCILPDIKNISMFIKEPAVGYLMFPMNSFAGVIAVATIFTLAFLREEKNSSLKTPFLLLSIAAVIHLLVDSLYWSFDGRLVPFYPFSTMRTGITIFSHNQEVLLLPMLITAIAVTIICRKVIRRKSNLYKSISGIKIKPDNIPKPVVSIAVLLCISFTMAMISLVNVAHASPTNPNLILNMTFDEGNGTTAYDYSGNENHGALNGNATWVDGKFGKALELDGSDDYVNVTTDRSGDMVGAWTLWAKLNEVKENMCLMDYYVDSSNRVKIYTRQNVTNYAFAFNLRSSNTWTIKHYESTEWLSADTWYYVAISQNGTNITMYVNGVLQAAPAIDSGDWLDDIGSGIVHIGGGDTGAGVGGFFNGTIDEVQIYDNALSEQEIKEIYLKRYAPAVSVSIVLNTTDDQNKMDTEAPSSIIGTTPARGNHPVPVFMAIDHISTTAGEKINFVLVCKNEGNASGSNNCIFVAKDSENTYIEECGNINEAGSVTTCRGSFTMGKGDLYLTPYASNGSAKNYLMFKIPGNMSRNGIITIFASPQLESESNTSNISYYHPLINGKGGSEDYGNYEWVLTGLEGFKDQEGNSITKYAVNTKTFLPKEGIVVWSNSARTFTLFDENGKKIQENDGNGILWLTSKDNTTYTLQIGSDIETITVEPNLVLEYSRENAETDDIKAGEYIGVEQSLSIKSYSTNRSQILAMTPNSTSSPNDFIKNSCTVGGGAKCQEDIIIQPGDSTTKKFSWKEGGVRLTHLGIKQNLSAISTPEIQHLIKKVGIENTNSKRNLTHIEAAVYMDGVCNNWVESKKIDWLGNWWKEHTCYVIVFDLPAGESVTKEVGYFGDWLDLEFGPLEQNPDKQSTIDRQYVRRQVKINFTKKSCRDIPWDIMINLSDKMPGNCTECQKNIVFGETKPVINMTFDEGNGSIAKDSSGNHNNGVLKPDGINESGYNESDEVEYNETNGPKWVDGKFGKALAFDGKDDHVDLGNKLNIGLNDFSFTAWIYPKNMGSDKYYDNVIFSKYQNADNLFHIRIRKKHFLQWYTKVDGTGYQKYVINLPADKQFVQDEWQHFAAVFERTGSNDTVRFYHNGEYVGDLYENANTSGVDISNTGFARIGVSGGGGYFNGTIDDVRIYDKALSEREIKEIYLGMVKEEKTFINSFIDKIEYEISKPEKSEITGNYQHWIQKIVIKNTVDFDFSNITVVFPTDLAIERNSVKSSENLIDLSFNDSKIYFTAPRIKVNSTNSYEIIFSTKVKPLTVSEKTAVTGISNFPLTGFAIFDMSNFLASAFVEKDLNKDLVLWLNFEEGGDINSITHDQSGNGNDGLIYGNPGWTVGKEGLALEFNGKANYVKVMHTDTLNISDSLTFSFWIYLNKKQRLTIIGKPGSFYFWNGHDNKIYFALYNNGEKFGQPHAFIYPNKWTHIAGTYEKGDKVKIYRNGQLSKESDYCYKSIDTNKNNIEIGLSSWGNSYFNGSIDEVKIYNRVLSPEEIRAVYEGRDKIYDSSVLFRGIFLSLCISLVMSFSYLRFLQIEVRKRKWNGLDV